MLSKPRTVVLPIDNGRVACPRKATDQDIESCFGCPDAIRVTDGGLTCAAREDRIGESDPLFGRANLP